MSHKSKLKGAKDAAKRIARTLYALGNEIETDAEISITQGSVSGAGHVPSQPGQPPNADTRHLDSNIETELDASNQNPTVTVTSRAEYSAALEFGTSKMAERPFMRPAVEKNRDKITDEIAATVRSAIRNQPGES